MARFLPHVWAVQFTFHPVSMSQEQVDSTRGEEFGTLQNAVNFPASNLTFAVAAGDFNQDGLLDLLTGNYDAYDILLQ
ncbi:MAG TPA: FG-GAP repeat protein [Terriglobales bacterium]|nr:FG-GAP repeat protein [Terriglobales bacterium]